MKAQIVDDENRIIWERGPGQQGIACRLYATDGMQQEIIATLKDALEQAETELSSFEEVDGILDIGGAAP